jgi:hypothetical protein
MRALVLVLAMAAAGGAAAAPHPSTVRLEGTLAVEVAPRLGGRLLHLSLPGRPNLLLVGDAVRARPEPEPDADGPHIPYMGHEVWVGPQADWWRFQDLNPARRRAAAQWPPDPWLAHAPARVLEQGEGHLRLEGAPSPVSGVRLVHGFTLAPDRPAIALEVEMRNIRREPVARDIWFNSRVPPETRVFVPVAADGGGVRVRSDTGGGYDGLVVRTADGLLSLELEPPDPGLHGRRGKVFIQPAAGWIAGFRAGQAFLIRFDHQPPERIHPEQGQVELYMDWRPDAADTGMLELEVHGPYTTLAPGAAVRAREEWTVLPYPGQDTPQAQAAFLPRLLEAAGVR